MNEPTLSGMWRLGGFSPENSRNQHERKLRRTFEESLKSLDMQPGAIITGIVVDIDGDWVTVHAGLKSEGVIPVEQFYNEQGELTIKVGDEVHVALDAVEDGFGETKLSREKPSARNPGLFWKRLSLQKKWSRASSTARSKVASPSTSTAFVRSCRVRWSMSALCATLPTWKAKSSSSRSSSSTRSATTLSFPPQRAGSREQRRARSSAGIPAGRPAGQGYRQEPHRLRCVR